MTKNIDSKGAAGPRKFVISTKNQIEKMRFQGPRYEKYLKYKNDLKRPLGPFHREL